MDKCFACPRACGVDRKKSIGYCGADDKIRIGKVMLHRFEEPVISGERGSGAIFFGGCNLRCVFCQNHEISHQNKGEVWSEEKLEEAIYSLEKAGAHNINLVTATHYAPLILPVLKRVKKNLSIPIVYNCSGYEKVDTLREFEGIVDIYLPDFKYFDSALSSAFSSAPDYFTVAVEAIKEMVRQKSKVKIENGLIKEGVIIRHLVLPAHREDSKRVLREIKDRFPTALVSIMRQYTPSFNRSPYPELNRKLTSFEYDEVVKFAVEIGLEGFTQEKGCESEEFTPNFKKVR